MCARRSRARIGTCVCALYVKRCVGSVTVRAGPLTYLTFPVSPSTPMSRGGERSRAYVSSTRFGLVSVDGWTLPDMERNVRQAREMHAGVLAEEHDFLR